MLHIKLSRFQCSNTTEILCSFILPTDKRNVNEQKNNYWIKLVKTHQWISNAVPEFGTQILSNFENHQIKWREKEAEWTYRNFLIWCSINALHSIWLCLSSIVTKRLKFTMDGQEYSLWENPETSVCNMIEKRKNYWVVVVLYFEA